MTAEAETEERPEVSAAAVVVVAEDAAAEPD